jgi:hypothetical protein
MAGCVGCVLGESALASCQMCKSKGVVSHFSVERELQMCRTCSTDEQIVCTCNTDGFCTCRADSESRVASSRRMQCWVMQCKSKQYYN